MSKSDRVDRKSLSVAHARIYELEQEFIQVRGELEVKVDKLQRELVAIAQERDALRERLEGLKTSLSDAELYALGAYVTTEHQGKTEAWKKLEAELKVRGILRGEQASDKWSKVEPMLRRLQELRSKMAVVGHTDLPQTIVDELISMVKRADA